jgi:hypothetical protein
VIATNRPARLNRALIALTGILLMVVGGYAVAARLGRLPWVDPHAALVPGTAAPPSWVLCAAIAGALVLGLAALRWLSVQAARLPRKRQWYMGSRDSSGHTMLDSGTAAAPVVADVEGYDGVRGAVARLSGPGRAPELHLVVTAEPEADLAELRRRILGHAVPRLRAALEVEVVPVSLELRLADRGRPARAR